MSLFDNDRDIARASRALRIMSHPLRLRAICLIGEREIGIADIAGRLGDSPPNLSRHLTALRDNGVLAARRDQKRVYYRLRSKRILELVSLVRELHCPEALVAAPEPGAAPDE